MNSKLMIWEFPKLITCCLCIIPGLGSGQSSCTVNQNQWIGNQSNTNWFTSSNWSNCGVGTLPNSQLSTYIGPIENFINGTFVDFTLPASEAKVSADFSTPSLTISAWDGISEITIEEGANLTSTALVGVEPINNYSPSGVVQPAIVNLNGGQLGGRWTFFQDSTVNILADFIQPSSVWTGTNGTINISNGTIFTADRLSVRDKISNEGILSFNDGSQFLAIGTSEAPTRLTGGGEILLTDSLIWSGGAESALINVDNTISGNGTISISELTNQALIKAENGTLQFTSSFTNEGTLTSGNAATLLLSNATRSIPVVVDNTEGLINISPEGTLSLSSNAKISGGAVNADLNSRLAASGGVLEGLHMTGNFSILGTPRFSGEIFNSGILTFDNNAQFVAIGTSEAPTRLTGGGEILLTDSLIWSGGAESALINVDNTISGNGTISISELTNQALIKAENGTLQFTSSFTNEGTLTSGNAATLLLSNATRSIPVVVDNTEGLINILPEGTLSLSSNAKISGGTVAANGRLVLSSSESQMVDSRLQGTGFIESRFEFGKRLSVIAPGNSAGALSTKVRKLNFAGILEIELNGNERGISYDTVQQIGEVSLGGSLKVTLDEDFRSSLTEQDSFTILSTGTDFLDFSSGLPISDYSGSQGTITGIFSNAAPGTRVITADGAGSFLVTQGAFSVVLSNYEAYTPFSDLTQETAMTDNDEDGVSLLFEFLFGGDPAKSDSVSPVSFSGKLQGDEISALDNSISVEPSSQYPIFDVVIRNERRGIIYVAKADGELNFVESAHRVLEIGSGVLEGDFIRHRFIILPSSGSTPPRKAFLQLEIDFSML